MHRGRIVVAFVLALGAIVAWVCVLADRTPSATRVASISVAPAPMPATPDAAIPDAAVLDGPIIDLGYGFEITLPSYVAPEKIPNEPHAIAYMDEGRAVRVVANAVPASRPKRHDDQLDGARELAKDQKTRITHYETTPDGSYVIFDGTFEHVPMRQHLISKRTATGRVSVWVILLGPGIDHPDNLAFVDELRSKGRLVGR